MPNKPLIGGGGILDLILSAYTGGAAGLGTALANRATGGRFSQIRGALAPGEEETPEGGTISPMEQSLDVQQPQLATPAMPEPRMGMGDTSPAIRDEMVGDLERAGSISPETANAFRAQATTMPRAVPAPTPQLPAAAPVMPMAQPVAPVGPAPLAGPGLSPYDPDILAGLRGGGVPY
jgi:hypothetical protein